MFNAIPTKIPMTFFTEIEKINIKYIQKHIKPQIARTTLSKSPMLEVYYPTEP
jgi:hypothetical protein